MVPATWLSTKNLAEISLGSLLLPIYGENARIILGEAGAHRCAVILDGADKWHCFLFDQGDRVAWDGLAVESAQIEIDPASLRRDRTIEYGDIELREGGVFVRALHVHPGGPRQPLWVQVRGTSVAPNSSALAARFFSWKIRQRDAGNDHTFFEHGPES